MSQVANMALPSTAKTPLQIASLKGRVSARRRINTKDGVIIITILRLPAPDEYTSPQTVELRSRAPLAAPGDEWEGQVRIGGYGRTYKATDPETGESKVVATADNSLTVVEQ